MKSSNHVISFTLVLILLIFEILNYYFTNVGFIDLINHSVKDYNLWIFILSAISCLLDFFSTVCLFRYRPGRESGSTIWLLFIVWFSAAFLNILVVWYGLSIILTTLWSLSGILLDLIPAFLWILRLLVTFALLGTHTLVGQPSLK